MKITREKIALLIFAALLAVVAAASVSYFFTSRNFNVAASYVDDQVGSMEDYTVVVYMNLSVLRGEADQFVHDDRLVAEIQRQCDGKIAHKIARQNDARMGIYIEYGYIHDT